MSKLFADLLDKESPASKSASSIEPEEGVKKPEPGQSLIRGQSQIQNEGKTKREQEKVSRNRDTTIPSNQDTLVETIRRAVKQLGREAGTYRFTTEEKRALDDIVYTYKARGIRTSGNEITRIGIHALIEEYRSTGETSILARVLERLNG
jgi:hypothetical protein